jgi:hypothetical protein
VLPSAPEPVDGVELVTWAASDPDGGELRFDVLASVDGGQTHRAVALAIEDASINLDTSMLAGGTNQLRVVASDGVHTAFADSAPFTVPPRPPKITITSPADGFQADWGQMITLEAEVSDLQDDFIPDDLVSWTGNLNGFFAIGRRVQIDQLPVGENVLQAHATNSHGASASASVTILVGDRLVPRGPTISVAPTSLAWHVADDDPATQIATLTVENAGSGSLRFDAASDADWVRLDSVTDVTDATAPRIFTISAAAALVMPGTTGTATLTLANRSDPNDVVVVPVALSRGNVFDHAVPASAPVCTGDCNGNGIVSIDELVRGVNIALNRALLSLCPAFDANADGQVFVNELVSAVAAALTGC